LTANLRFGPVAFITFGLAFACLSTVWQKWRNGDISENGLRESAEGSAISLLSNWGATTFKETKINDFQSRRAGSDAEFSGKITLDRSRFQNRFSFFKPQGSVTFRLSGTATLTEHPETVLGVDLYKLTYKDTRVALERDDPRSTAELEEVAWEDVGNEVQWLYDLAVTSEKFGFNKAPSAAQQALALRALRREKRFQGLLEILEWMTEPATGAWLNRLEVEKRKLWAEIKASPEAQTNLSSDLSLLKFLLTVKREDGPGPFTSSGKSMRKWPTARP
jgi:hypothetical protein